MGRFTTSAVGALLIGSLAGCALFEARRNMQELAQAAVLSGEVHSPSRASKPVVVFLFQENDAGEPTVRSYYVRYGSGPFEFRPFAGPTYLFALEDEDNRWSEGEPSAWYGSLASQLAPPAQDGAVAIYGVAADHRAILRSPALIRKLSAVFAARTDR